MAVDRYIRHEQLKGFGLERQAKLANASVLVVGLGGLGLPVAQYLNAMGVGTLGLVEQDIVEIHNLQRQVLYDEDDVGRPKLEVVLHKLSRQNPHTSLKPFDTFLTKDNALKICKEFDVIVDATDNFPTRYLMSDVCVILNKPLVYGALHGFEGQVSVFNYEEGPTYRCLFPNMPKSEDIPNCDENGVLGILPGIIGNLQALETVKVLAELGEVLSGKLLIYDGLSQTTRKIRFEVNPENKKITHLQESYSVTGCSSSQIITATAFLTLHEKQALQLIDVRNEAEFDDIHCYGAKNIPLPKLEGQLGAIDFDRPVYLVCQSGKRSEIALKKLQELRPDAHILHILGGMNQMKHYGIGSR